MTQSEIPRSPTQRKTAAVLGCDPGPTEIITLVLEILGWSIGTVDRHLTGAQLAFVGIQNVADFPGAKDGSVVVVLVSSRDAMPADPRFGHLARLYTPVDVAAVEQIIIAAS